MKTNFKQLKAALAPGIKKLGLDSVIPKFGKFLIFDGFFDFSPLNLDNFRDLANFSPFNVPNFLACSILLPPNLSTSPLSSFLPEAGVLLLFLQETNLLPLFLLGAGLLVIFNIEVNGTAILLKPWMNCQ